MPYAVYLEFDDTISAKIEALAERAKEASGGRITMPSQIGHRPHITLEFFSEVESEERVVSSAVALASGLHFIDLKICSIGWFPGTNSAVYIAPVMTPALAAAHHRYHQMSSGAGRGSAYCRPSAWVPHITIAFGVAPGEIGLIATELSADWHDLSGRIERLRVVRTSPTINVWSAPLSAKS